MKTSKSNRRIAKRLFGLCTIGGALDERRALLVAKRLAASTRRQSVAVLRHFHKLVARELQRHTARIASATPLSPELRSTLLAGLEHRYGYGLLTAFVQQPELIGGMRIRVASDVYDTSVRGRLLAIQSRFGDWNGGPSMN